MDWHALLLTVLAVLATMGASALGAAVLPRPAPGTVLAAVFALLDALACNWMKARNVAATAKALVLLGLVSIALIACSAAQKAQIAAAPSLGAKAITVADIGVTDGQLYCKQVGALAPVAVAAAVAAGVSPTVATAVAAAAVAVAAASPLPSPVSVIGKTAASVAAICAGLNAVPVPAPATPGSVPVVTVSAT